MANSRIHKRVIEDDDDGPSTSSKHVKVKTMRNDTPTEAPLPFGDSHWDYLPDMIQDYIQDLATRSLHRDRMKQVCRSLTLHGRVCRSQKWRMYNQHCCLCNHCARQRRHGTIDDMLAKLRLVNNPRPVHWTNAYCDDCYQDEMQ